MKNLFKFGFLALALSLSVAACNSEKKAEGTDSPAVEATVDTNAVDTNAVDSNAVDSNAAAPAAH